MPQLWGLSILTYIKSQFSWLIMVNRHVEFLEDHPTNGFSLRSNHAWLVHALRNGIIVSDNPTNKGDLLTKLLGL